MIDSYTFGTRKWLSPPRIQKAASSRWEVETSAPGTAVTLSGHAVRVACRFRFVYRRSRILAFVGLPIVMVAVVLIGLSVDERDPIVVMKWKETLDFLEHATDRCEDVANLLEGVIVKHA